MGLSQPWRQAVPPTAEESLHPSEEVRKVRRRPPPPTRRPPPTTARPPSDAHRRPRHRRNRRAMRPAVFTTEHDRVITGADRTEVNRRTGVLATGVHMIQYARSARHVCMGPGCRMIQLRSFIGHRWLSKGQQGTMLVNIFGFVSSAYQLLFFFISFSSAYIALHNIAQHIYSNIAHCTCTMLE